MSRREPAELLGPQQPHAGRGPGRQRLPSWLAAFLLVIVSRHWACLGADKMAAKKTHRNRLAEATSPYLLQHADNPVDWHPWGTEALERAKREGKPILLSIGYSACHWCHVMARESFSSETIAALMNRHFVCIKVDREERPDLDAIYMNAVQMMTGRGGWPLTVFLTPDLKPFFGGTYFPPEDRHGLIGFPTLLERVAEAYRTQRKAIERSGDSVVQSLQRLSDASAGAPAGAESLGPASLERATQALLDTLDAEHGGFGRAPKFPQSAALLLLLDEHARTGSRAALAAADLTLRGMADGGIHDHLAGGFHRYSVDRFWRVPHFEKMLYDNALLARVYTRAWQQTRNDRYAATARRTLDFLLGTLRDERGGFHGTLDADTEHEEGAYYVWTLAQVEQALGKDAAGRFAAVYGLTREGNFEHGTNVLHVATDPERAAAAAGMSVADLEKDLAESRAALLALRARRTPPAVDRKILTSWNGMAIGSLALAGTALRRQDYVAAAERAAAFILARHRVGGGAADDPVLAHSSIGGHVGGPAFLDGYAYFIGGLLDLYDATLDPRHLLEADRLARQMLRRFGDPDGGAFFYVAAPAASAVPLPVRPRKLMDGSVPSPVAVAWESLLRLADQTGAAELAEAASTQEKALARAVRAFPDGHRFALHVASRRLRPHVQITVVGPPAHEGTRALLHAIREHRGADAAVLLVDPSEKGDRLRAAAPLARDKPMHDGRPTAYVCRGRTCFPPVTEANNLEALLRAEAPTRHNRAKEAIQ